MTRESRVNALIMALLLAVPLIALVIDEPFYITLATRASILAIAGLGLNLALGQGGLVSFGHATFFGLGGYAMGILASHAQSYTPLIESPLLINGTNSMPIIWLVAILVSGLAALVDWCLEPANQRGVLHHDHAGIRADVLLLYNQLVGVRR